MTKTGKFVVDVFDCNVHIVVAKSIKSSINYHLRKYGQELLDFEPSGYYCRPDGDKIGNYYILFNEADVSVDIINHEKSHLVEDILLDRGIKPVDEIRSYLDGFISHKVDLFFKNRKIKVRNKR